MPKIRTTITPGEVIDVPAAEALYLSSQRLVKEYVADAGPDAGGEDQPDPQEVPPVPGEPEHDPAPRTTARRSTPSKES